MHIAVTSAYIAVSCANHFALANFDLILAYKDVEEPRLTRLGLPVVDGGAVKHHCREWKELSLIDMTIDVLSVTSR